MDAEPGEHIVDASAEPGRDGKWRFYVGIDGDGFNLDMEPMGGRAIADGVSGPCQQADPGSGLTLLQYSYGANHERRGSVGRLEISIKEPE